ncbi:MAG: S8 family serine peptidase [Ideonella sp.]|nr:S8 family serine peptidase [Ideonella sp.]
MSFSVASGAIAQTAAAEAQSSRTVITQADQLPRRTVTLPKLPSELLVVPLAELQAIAAPVEKNLLLDLQRYDIRDAATQREYYAALAAMAQLRGDWAAVPQWTTKARALQEKAGGKLTSGLLTDLLSQQQAERRDAAWLQAEVKRRYGAMPWVDVQDVVKANKGGIETFNPELIKGAFQSQVDAMAKNGQMTIPEGLVIAIVNSRMQIELLAPNKQAVVAGLQAVIDGQAQTAAKPDIWTPRTFAIPDNAQAQAVVVGIWDSGVDLSLFKAAAAKGIAFDDEARPSPHLLRPLGEAAPRWPELRAVIKGALDQRAALDTPESRAFRAKMASLKADQVKAFSEDASLAGLYVHGTHVAGIAVEGNPLAQVYAATMLWSHLSEPFKPSEARSKATAAAFTATVQGFKQAGVKVVNMSWRYGPSAYEGAMAYHSMGGSPEQRKQEAQRLFKIERDALRDAIAGAPEIFFVAGSGNEDNSADFEEYIPAGFSLPNLITVGAVDKAGTETSFSTFGKTVAVHANGFEVEAPVPGGVRMKLSGTSMASPQVANLAAKLLALKPSLTPVQLKAAIMEGAERLPGADGKPGRVNLINPRKSAALVGLTLAP